MVFCACRSPETKTAESKPFFEELEALILACIYKSKRSAHDRFNIAVQNSCDDLGLTQSVTNIMEITQCAN